MPYKTILGLLMVNLIVIYLVYMHPQFMFTLYFSVPLLLLSIHDTFQEKHALMRNFPIIGRFRWGMEFIRPFIQQYLIEPDTGGAPISVCFEPSFINVRRAIAILFHLARK